MTTEHQHELDFDHTPEPDKVLKGSIEASNAILGMIAKGVELSANNVTYKLDIAKEMLEQQMDFRILQDILDTKQLLQEQLDDPNTTDAEKALLNFHLVQTNQRLQNTLIRSGVEPEVAKNAAGLIGQTVDNGQAKIDAPKKKTAKKK